MHKSPPTEEQIRESIKERFLTDKQVADRYGVQRSSIWRWTQTGFPCPVKLSPGCSRWRLSDLLGWELQNLYK